jgi:hypothetical protein
LHVGHHGLYLPMDWHSKRLSEVRVVEVVDDKEVVIPSDEVHNTAAAPL